MDCLIISGMSGAGKSLAADVLEDAGYYCVDNMPASLIPRFAELFSSSSAKYKKVAFVVDVRGGESRESIVSVKRQLNQTGLSCRMLFLDCRDDALINRHKATRRRHPLDDSGNIADAIARERKLMEPIRAEADYIIDTTALSRATLKSHILNMFGGEKGKTPILLENYGRDWYKYNIQVPYRNKTREYVSTSSPFDLISNREVITEIDSMVLEYMQEYVQELSKVKEIPIKVVSVTTGAARPNKDQLDEMNQTAAAIQKTKTQERLKEMETVREAAEKQRAKADKAYMREMNLTADQYIQLRAWSIIEQKKDANVDVLFDGSSQHMWNIRR